MTGHLFRRANFNRFKVVYTYAYGSNISQVSHDHPCKILVFVNPCSPGISSVIVRERTLEEAYNKLVTGSVQAEVEQNITSILGHTA